VILKQDSVRKLLYQLGFLEAPRWDDDKLREIAREVPRRFMEDQVPERYRELYAKLVIAAETKEFITLKKTIS
jgi:hypothetical protein